ncbi:hypothetical protein BDSB_26410 [Burkholderia dolosa PC543]|nr:hypothetical protein BDSB_26410 [Burkholderia dolosa PC543]
MRAASHSSPEAAGAVRWRTTKAACEAATGPLPDHGIVGMAGRA